VDAAPIQETETFPDASAAPDRARAAMVDVRLPGTDATGVLDGPVAETSPADGPATPENVDASPPAKGDAPSTLDAGGAIGTVLLLFRSTFDDASSLQGWVTHRGIWQIVGGALRGEELASENHFAILTHDNVKLVRTRLTLRMRLEGLDRWNFFYQSRVGKDRLLRVAFTPNELILYKLSGPDGRTVLKTVSMNLMVGRWYTVGVDFDGRYVKVDLDGQRVMEGDVGDRSATPADTLVFNLNGRYLSVDDVLVVARP
jgi:hypothetical protein